MGTPMYKLSIQPSRETKPPDLKVPTIRMIHKPPIMREEIIRDASKANDLLLSLRIYLQNRSTN